MKGKSILSIVVVLVLATSLGFGQNDKKKLQESRGFHLPIVTQIVPVKTFYIAEDYHQN